MTFAVRIDAVGRGSGSRHCVTLEDEAAGSKGVSDKASFERILEPLTVLERHRGGDLPRAFRVRAPDPCAIHAYRGEVLRVEREPARPGDAVCVVSGSRLAWRRVLEINRDRAYLRGDLAPFADGWCGDVVGRVVPRAVDKLAAFTGPRFAELGWATSMTAARAFAAYRRLRHGPREPNAFSVRALSLDDWQRVRAFWVHACGSPLPLKPQPSQHIVGLFLANGAIAGVNIQLVLGDASFAAYTLMDRRHRGLGGGRKMIGAALDVARKLGVKLMYVHIPARNLPSIAAYEASGFHFAHWWTDPTDPLLAAERQWRVYEREV